MGFHMNITEYANRYTGRNQILRLVHIANHCTGPMYNRGNIMELQALRMAYELILQGGGEAFDVRLFKLVAEKIAGRLGEDYPFDEAFCRDKERQREILINNSTKINDSLQISSHDQEIKIRSATYRYNLLYSCGNMHEHFEAFGILNPPIEASMSTILVALETRTFDVVRSRTLAMNRAYDRNAEYRFKLDCASALADLGESKYYSAAEGFVKLFDRVHMYEYSEVLSSEDILTYGLVCALATFDRVKLLVAVSKVREPTGVVYQLREIVRPYQVVHNLTEIIKNFVAQDRFTNCIGLFEEQRPRLLLDMYLVNHVGYLFGEIRDLMVAAYLRSFSTIMVDNFTLGMVAPSNEQEELRIILDSGGLVVPESQVLRLIQSNKIQGRIEVHYGRKFFSHIGGDPSEGTFGNFTAPRHLTP